MAKKKPITRMKRLIEATESGLMPKFVLALQIDAKPDLYKKAMKQLGRTV